MFAGTTGRVIPKDKKTYQQDPANYREALREAQLDEVEGADIMMVKPGLPYLDVIRLLRDNSTLPIAAYHVSGEIKINRLGLGMTCVGWNLLLQLVNAGSPFLPILLSTACNKTHGS